MIEIRNSRSSYQNTDSYSRLSADILIE